jgi:hypothetical protein
MFTNRMNSNFKHTKRDQESPDDPTSRTSGVAHTGLLTLSLRTKECSNNTYLRSGVTSPNQPLLIPTS